MFLWNNFLDLCFLLLLEYHWFPFLIVILNQFGVWCIIFVRERWLRILEYFLDVLGVVIIHKNIKFFLIKIFIVLLRKISINFTFSKSLLKIYFIILTNKLLSIFDGISPLYRLQLLLQELNKPCISILKNLIISLLKLLIHVQQIFHWQLIQKTIGQSLHWKLSKHMVIFLLKKLTYRLVLADGKIKQI